MLNNQKTPDRHDHYTRLAQLAVADSGSDDYQRGYLQGLRCRYYREQFGASSELAQWRASADSPEYPEFGRGYRDGLAGIEPQG